MVHAPTIFEEQGVRATFYAVPGRVGGASDWDEDLARPLADWDILREAQSHGHEIGNHSENHIRLGELSADEQFSEIATAHEHLVSHGLKPRSFCFPYGSHNAETLAMLQKANYGVGLALGKRPTRSGDNPLNLPRVVVAYSDSLPMLLYKLTLKPLLRRHR